MLSVVGDPFSGVDVAIGVGGSRRHLLVGVVSAVAGGMTVVGSAAMLAGVASKSNGLPGCCSIFYTARAGFLLT